MYVKNEKERKCVKIHFLQTWCSDIKQCFLTQFLIPDTDLRWRILSPQAPFIVICNSQVVFKLQVLKQKMKSGILYTYSVFFTC